MGYSTRLLWSAVAAAAAAAVAAAASASGTACPLTADDMGDLAEEIGLRARARDFQVFQGRAVWVLACALADDDDDPDCKGDDNPDGSYMQYTFDAHAVLPDGLCELNGETCDGDTTASLPLGARDALVWLGCTPPPSRFFSLDVVVSDRITGPDPRPDSDHFAPGCPFGDALNMLSAPFGPDQPTVVVHAFDGATSGMVAAAVNASAPAAVRFRLHPLNDSLVRVWRNTTLPIGRTRPDSFRPLVRWSVPAGGTAAEREAKAYVKKAWPVLLLRKVDSSSGPMERLAPPLRARQDGRDETRAHGNSVASLGRSLAAWMRRSFGMGRRASDQLNMQLPGMTDDFAGVLAGEIGGDYLNTRDAAYGYGWLRAGARVPVALGAGGAAVLIGVAHTSANKSTYNSVTLGNDDLRWSSTYLDSAMEGSARAFAVLLGGDAADGAPPLNDGALDDLFVLAWRRRGSPFVCPTGAARKFCETMPELDGDNSSVGLLGAERAYLNPRTKTGPAPEEIFGAALLTFEPEPPVALSSAGT